MLLHPSGKVGIIQCSPLVPLLQQEVCEDDQRAICSDQLLDPLVSGVGDEFGEAHIGIDS